MDETPRANRIHIAFFGLRNAGKSTLVNAFTGQQLAIVSDTPGTTTDPVSKAMEILPLGPCLVTDTAGLDDIGELGSQRVRKTLDVLATTDVAVWVWSEGEKIGGESRWTADDLISSVTRRDAASTGEATSSSLQAEQNVFYREFIIQCRQRHVTVLEYRRGDSVAALRAKIAGLRLADDTPGLLDGLVAPGDRVVCVCPIDAAAPKGRLILPQVQVIRDCLDRHVACTVCQPEELASVLRISDCQLQIAKACGAKADGVKACGANQGRARLLVITDSQTFGTVREILNRSSLLPHVSRPCGEDARHETRDGSCKDARRETRNASNQTIKQSNNQTILLTSFSILFARQKGDLDAYREGLAAIRGLRDGDTVLVAEGCTHHRQCNDIGTVKIPKALEKLSGKKLNFRFVSGGDFVDAASSPRPSENQPSAVDLLSSPTFSFSPALIVQCGGCMLTRREVLRRIGVARAAGIPIVNYGMLLALAAGLPIETLTPSTPSTLSTQS